MVWFFVFILGILAFALLIDWRRKKRKDNLQKPINPNAKPGDDSNYMMGDNKDTGGFQ
jgi:hypothetical protein